MSLHYGTPASFTSDYGLLSRYAVHQRDNHESAEQESLLSRDEDAQSVLTEREVDQDLPDSPVRSKRRQTSLSSMGERRPRPAMAIANVQVIPLSVPNIPVPTERTPLLNQSETIPRIAEEVDDQSERERSTLKQSAEEARILFKYTMPVFGSHVFEYSLVVASVISIGHISTTALAASTLGSMTSSVTAWSVLQGFASTLDTLLPSAWTSSQPQLVGLWSQRMTVVLAACLVPIYAVWFNSEAILLLLKQDPEVARLAATYLKCISIGLPAYAFNTVARRYFQSQGLFTVPTRIIILVAPINALLNYLLVWGPKPFGLGFIGAPIATGVSFNLISLCFIVYGIFYAPKTAWHPVTKRCLTGLPLLVQLGLAGVGQVASEWWSWELVGLAASQLGPVALAAQSVLLVSASVTYQAPFALSVAACVRVGNLLGEENAQRAGVAARTSLLLTLVLSAVSSAMFMIFRNSWGYLFNGDREVVSLVASILPIVALFQVFDGLGGAAGGILRSRGKQATGALLNLSAYYVIGIPFGIWLAFKRDMALSGLWIGLTVSLVYCAALGVWLCLKTDWNREVEKVVARLEADKRRETETQV